MFFRDFWETHLIVFVNNLHRRKIKMSYRVKLQWALLSQMSKNLNLFNFLMFTLSKLFHWLQTSRIQQTIQFRRSLLYFLSKWRTLTCYFSLKWQSLISFLVFANFNLGRKWKSVHSATLQSCWLSKLCVSQCRSGILVISPW